MSDWPTLSVDELCSRVTSGGTPSRSRPDFYGGAIPWIKTGELQDRVIFGSEEQLTDAGLMESSAKLLPVGTVLMAMYGATVGALAQLGIEATCNQASCAMVADPRCCDPRWLYYSLLNDRQRIVGRATGAAQQNLSAATIKQFTFPTPPLAEQQAIAEVLGALDDKIAANTALAATAEMVAIAEMSRVARKAPLGELTKLTKSQLRPEQFASTEVDHFSLPAFDADRLPAVELGGAIKSSKFVFDSPVVLLSRLNPRFPRIWRAAPRSGTLALASTEFMVLEATSTSPAILWAVLAQPDFTSQMDARVAGTSGSHQRVRPAEVLQMQTTDPRAMSTALATLVEKSLAAADVARWENRTLIGTRDALLPQLMSGKLRVRDAEALASAAGA